MSAIRSGIVSGRVAGVKSGPNWWDGANASPTAEFSSVVAVRQVTFTDESTDSDGTIASWAWDFGDGSGTSTDQNPVYTYATVDTFTVTLTVTDDQDATDEVEHDVTTTRATIAVTHLASSSSTTDGTAFSTASVSPTANAVVLLAVFSCRTAGAAEAPATITGNGLTWTQIDTTRLYGTSNFRSLSLWRGMSATPSASTIDLTFTSSHESVAWSVCQATGVNTSGTNGSGAIVQAVSADSDNGTGTSRTNSLAAFEYAGNVHFAAWATSINSGIGVDAQFAELGDAAVSTPSGNVETQWAAGEVDCTATFGAASNAVISVEIKAG